MNVAAGHTLTLDGQAETDYYFVYTTGSHGSQRNYVDQRARHGRVGTTASTSSRSSAPTRRTRRRRHRARSTRPTTSSCCAPRRASRTTAPTTAPRCTTPSETADRPAYVALLAGDSGNPVGQPRDLRRRQRPRLLPRQHRRQRAGRANATASRSPVQRINYDTALNGRLTVYGLGGNDAFFADDTSAIVTLDGGAGDDSFQIGQIFGTKRDAEPTEGAPARRTTSSRSLIATTRGWLSPGIARAAGRAGRHRQRRVHVYSNQAELRLEGDDDNDLFIVRAFALAAVCDTDANGDGVCTCADIDLAADPATGSFPVVNGTKTVCTRPTNAGYDCDG